MASAWRGTECRRPARAQPRARDARHVRTRLEDRPSRDAGRDERAHRIGRAQRDPHAAVAEDEEQHDHRERSRETELVAEDREDRVGVWEGQIPELLATRAQALTE